MHICTGSCPKGYSVSQHTFSLWVFSVLKEYLALLSAHCLHYDDATQIVLLFRRSILKSIQM